MTRAAIFGFLLLLGGGAQAQPPGEEAREASPGRSDVETPPGYGVAFLGPKSGLETLGREERPERHLARLRLDERARGVGAVLDSGRILTSLSSVGSGRNLTAKLDDGREAPLRVLRTHRGYDLALLAIDGAVPSRALGLSMHTSGTRALVFAGETARAQRFEGRRLSRALGADAVAISAALLPGNPLPLGTPVVDDDGHLTGLAVRACVPRDTEPDSACKERDVVLGAALLRAFLEGSETGASVGWLGAGVELHDNGWIRGLRVVAVEPGSPAQLATLHAAVAGRDGDVLVALNGVPIGTPRRLHEMIVGMLPGTPVDLLLLRDGVLRHVGVTLGAQPRVENAWQLNPPLIQPPSPWAGF